ncbi:MAG: hypothetical protein M3313_02360 [Actinomycetota bacterium]|nr:hypothetical protein [Actinomycetota bacterium]
MTRSHALSDPITRRTIGLLAGAMFVVVAGVPSLTRQGLDNCGWAIRRADGEEEFSGSATKTPATISPIRKPATNRGIQVDPRAHGAGAALAFDSLIIACILLALRLKAESSSATAWDEQDVTAEDIQAICDFYENLQSEFTRSREWVSSEGLADPSHSKTVRKTDAGAVATDGPYIEAKEPWCPACGGQAVARLRRTGPAPVLADSGRLPHHDRPAPQ